MLILADIVVFVHFLWIIFLVFGAFLGVRHKIIKAAHLLGLLFAVIMQVAGWYCPLTYLENWLRSRQDPSATYEGSFIIQYLERIVYIEVSRELILAGTIVLVVITIWVYRHKAR